LEWEKELAARRHRNSQPRQPRCEGTKKPLWVAQRLFASRRF